MKEPLLNDVLKTIRISSSSPIQSHRPKLRGYLSRHRIEGAVGLTQRLSQVSTEPVKRRSTVPSFLDPYEVSSKTDPLTSGMPLLLEKQGH
jgi:hypothetical protein